MVRILLVLWGAAGGAFLTAAMYEIVLFWPDTPDSAVIIMLAMLATVTGAAVRGAIRREDLGR